MQPPFVTDPEHAVCVICPAPRLPRAAFVAHDRPSRECPFDPADGYRYPAGRIPACVHPHRLGVDADRTAPRADASTAPGVKPHHR
ncbi:hypothetical protein ACGFXC_35680 [Streptomyces sp. NPDC048507]|uniref:hypothetical protein n=1 Tax=Streptomyces sp. NPDC048507 TaxID=3365560 RepID=UPI00370FB000